MPIHGWSEVRRVAIHERRGGWEVRVYAGVDPVTGKPHRVSRQIQGSRRKAEREETRLKAQVMEGRHRGARAKILAELVDLYLGWNCRLTPIAARVAQ